MPGSAPPDESPLANVLVLGTADWDAPIATNQHYVVRELAQAAQVTFVESLGLRRPTIRRDDLVRMASRIRKAVGGELPSARRPRPQRTHVVSPLVLPVHRAPTRVLNRTLLRRATAGWLGDSSPKVLWTFTPVTYGLEAFADLVIYHCVDLLGAFPGVDGRAVGRGERRLSTRTAVAIATSGVVADHLAETGFPRVIQLPNVADVTLFQSASRPASRRHATALFSGNLSMHKLDVPLLDSIAASIGGQDGELLLAGPLGAGGGGFGPALQRLQALGARYLGLLTPEQLADVAGTCAVGVIPYAINDYTRGVSPLKCFEYLASGMSVLSTRLPAVEELAQVNRHVVTADPIDIPGLLNRMLRPVSDETIDSRMASASQHGWEERGRALRDLLASELSSRR